MSDYDPVKEGARLALEDATRSLGEEANQGAEGMYDAMEVSIQDVADWIANWQRALENYRKHFPVAPPTPQQL